MNWNGLNRNGTSPCRQVITGEARGFSKKVQKKTNNFLMVWFPPQKIKNPRIGMLLCICLAIN